MYFDAAFGILDATISKNVTVIHRHPPRRVVLLSAVFVLFLVTSLSAGEYKLVEPSQMGRLSRYQIGIDVTGELKLNSQSSNILRLPLAVKGNFEFEEKLIDGHCLSDYRAVRFYRQANAEIRIEGNLQKPRLEDDRRLIVVQATADGVTFFSPLGPLTRAQLDLIDVPCASGSGCGLLPEIAVNIGDTWNPKLKALARLLGIETITDTNIQSTLREIKNGIAVIEIEGRANGLVRGVATEIDVKCKCNYSLAAKQITWLAMAIKENRAISISEPGFEVTTRLGIAIGPLDRSQELDDAALAGLPLKSPPATTLLRFESAENAFQMLHERRWQLILDRADVTILRLIDGGDLIAQCNISKLPPLADGAGLQLKQFQDDIRRTLGNNFGHFVEASQFASENRLQVLRVVAAGTTSDLPIQWTYYHFSDSQGQRAALVFTLQASLIERFAAADENLISSFELTNRNSGSSVESSGAPVEAAKAATASTGLPPSNATTR
jgi:hypothetical protein